MSASTFLPEERNFFRIVTHYNPLPLYSHFYHWFELARMDNEPHPSPIRKGALLYNIFDSRNEGTATGVEEMFMHAGLYDDNPRSLGSSSGSCWHSAQPADSVRCMRTPTR